MDNISVCLGGYKQLKLVSWGVRQIAVWGLQAISVAVWGVVDNCFCECLGVQANSMAVRRVLNYCDDCLGGAVQLY